VLLHGSFYVVCCSVESGDLKVLQFALSIGVRPSIDVGGRTLLMQAARAGNRPATVYLIDHAAELRLDPHAVDVAAGESALFYGVRSGSCPVVDTLLDNARLRPTPNAAGRDPVDCALNEAGPAASDVLRTLLDRFPDAIGRRRGDAGLTVLHRFVERGQLSMLRRYAPDNYRPGALFITNNVGTFWIPKGFPSATNVVLLVIRCSIPLGFVNTQPILIKLHAHRHL